MQHCLISMILAGFGPSQANIYRRTFFFQSSCEKSLKYASFENTPNHMAMDVNKNLAVYFEIWNFRCSKNRVAGCRTCSTCWTCRSCRLLLPGADCFNLENGPNKFAWKWAKGEQIHLIGPVQWYVTTRVSISHLTYLLLITALVFCQTICIIHFCLTTYIFSQQGPRRSWVLHQQILCV